MAGIPKNPSIYHIVHLDNLSGIAESGFIWSDKKRLELNLNCQIVGMAGIKDRRLSLPVKCHPGTYVGEYTPFYFCPRSIMLFILFRGNHPEIIYREGQVPIVHLMTELDSAVAWATFHQRPWAFSNRNAGARYTDFYAALDDLDKVNWAAVRSNDFRNPGVKEGKQAEFLVYESFPWNLVKRIGVINLDVKGKVEEILRESLHKPLVTVERGWYY